MSDLLMETIASMLAEYETLDGEEVEVSIPQYGADRAKLKIKIGGLPYTIIVKDV